MPCTRFGLAFAVLGLGLVACGNRVADVKVPDAGADLHTGDAPGADGPTLEAPASSDSTGPGNDGGADAGDSAGSGDGGLVPVTCQIANPKCNDGVDNDDDTFKDVFDPECQSPCDDDEASFATGIPGDNIDACKQDCFFDGNSGGGDDGCEWNFKCDSANPGGTSCPYDSSYNHCPGKQSAKCVRNCQKLTPNGCDCFGCCAVAVGGEIKTVMLAATCTAAKFGDPVACPRCTQNQDCVNTCDKCEVCIGRPAPDPSCNATGTPDGGSTGADAGGTTGQCAAGTKTCGPGGAVAADACGAGYFCQTGCCVQYAID